MISFSDGIRFVASEELTIMLLPRDFIRYDRQIIMEEIGTAGQNKLKKARVVVAGAGGLGSPVSIYLAAAGVGTLRIIDCDTVETGNLNRQVLYGINDVGRLKIDAARHRLSELNPDITVEGVNEKITGANAVKLADGFDIIVDGMDNLPSRYNLNKAAIIKKIPFVYGAVSGFEGRVMTVLPGKSACLMCLLGGTVLEGKTPVIGVTPAVIGAIEATEVIKYITGTGQLLTDRLLVYNGLTMKFSELQIKRNPECPDCGKV
jgi:molybdopterin-synthase adenylyltransferase